MVTVDLEKRICTFMKEIYVKIKLVKLKHVKNAIKEFALTIRTINGANLVHFVPIDISMEKTLLNK